MSYWQYSRRLGRGIMAASLIVLMCGMLACDGGQGEAIAEAERLAEEALRQEKRAESERVLKEAEARAREAAEAEAEAAREALEASQQLLEEKAKQLAAREAEVARQQALLEQKERVAAREAELAARARDLLAIERDLEAREVELALAAEQLKEHQEVVSDAEVETPALEQSLGSGTTVDDEEAVPTTSEVTSSRASLQAGRVFEVEILETLSSRTSRVGDSFEARLVGDLRAEDGTLVIPRGAEVVGKITEVTPLKRVGGQASLGIEFVRIIPPSGEATEIRASFYEMGADKRRDKKKIIGAAVAGAILGRVLGGKGGENAAVGAVVGAAAGTAAVARAQGRDAEIPVGEMLALQLEEVVTVDVEMTGTVDG